MGSDHGNRIAGLPCGADRERNERARIASQIVFAARFEGGGP